MNALAQLKPMLSRLKLSGILNNLEVRLKEAEEQHLSLSDFLISLFQDEIDRRDAQSLGLRLKRGHLAPGKTLETFDFSASPKLSRSLISELANCSFIERKENVIIVGPSGVGKTHLAQALGHEAARNGYDVWSDRAAAVLSWLNGGRGDGSYDRRLKQITEVPLLILDDFGLTELSVREQSDVYELIAGRYERTSTIITSNRDVSEWFSLFQNPLLASAAIDRLSHRGVRMVIEGESYRLKEAQKLNRQYTDFAVEKTGN